MIRRATEADIPQLLVMGEQFAAYAPYKVTYSPEATESTVRGLLQAGVIIVSETDGILAGVLLGMLTPIWYSAGATAAIELAWWVSPEHRGGRHAVGMVKAFEQWGKEQGASFVSLCDMCIEGEFPAGPLFGRMGYHTAERTHMKEI